MRRRTQANEVSKFDRVTQFSYLEEQCKRLSIPLKWPNNLEEFNQSMLKYREAKNQSETNLFDEICKDVHSNANFTRQQLTLLKSYEDDLNKLEEQKAVLEAAGDILAQQKI